MRLFRALRIIIALSWLSSCTECFSAETIGMVCKQKSELSGEHLVHLKVNSAVKLYDRSSGIGVIAKAPTWKVHLYNTAARTYYENEPNKIRGVVAKQLAFVIGENPNSLHWRKGESKIVSGMKAQEYKTNLTDIETGKPSPKRPAQYWLAYEQLLPVPVANMVCRIYGMPELSSFPIKLILTNGASKIVDGLQTTEVQKKTILSSEFDPPKGFRKVPTERDVFVDSEGVSEIEEMVHSMEKKKF